MKSFIRYYLRRRQGAMWSTSGSKTVAICGAAFETGEGWLLVLAFLFGVLLCREAQFVGLLCTLWWLHWCSM